MKLLYTILLLIFSHSLTAGIGDSSLLHHPTAITLNLTVINTTCQKNNGKILIYPSGGIAPYQYRNLTLNVPLPGPYNFYLKAGTYTIEVTDAIGQVATQTVTLTNSFVNPSASVVSKTLPTGCTTKDATLTLQGSGGLPPYTYTLDGYNYQTSNVYSNLTAGFYQYSVKDANGCKSIDRPLSALLSAAEINDNCFPLHYNGSTGAISCNPLIISYDFNPPPAGNGGTPPYTYSKDGINFQTSTFFDSVPTGVFTIWMKDASGYLLLMSISYIFECQTNFKLTTITQPAFCGQNGSITATATEGIPPYTYSIDGVNFQVSNQFTGLAPGSYTVTAKDSFNLTTAILANVPNNCVTVSATTTSSTCGNSNGKITAQAGNGTAPYQYSLDGVTYTVNNIFSNLAAGNYTLYTKDGIGSVGTANIIINNIASPQITAVDTVATGCNNQSGSIKVTAIGIATPLQYSIDGVSFKTSNVFTGLAQGNYTITVKDTNNCSVTVPAIITTSSTLPTVNLGIDTTLCEGNTILLDATNPTATYQWQDNSSSPTYLVTKQGNYFVTVTKQGCVAKDTVNINYNLKPQFTLGADTRICQGSTIILNPNISGVSFLWQDGATTPTYTVTQPNLYSLTASNSCGSTTDYINIGNGVCNLYVPNSFTPNGDGKNDLFKASYSDNVTEYHLQILNRYGQIIFATTDKYKGWDGSFSNTPQPQGAYTWLITYKTATDNNLQKTQGMVLLLR